MTNPLALYRRYVARRLVRKQDRLNGRLFVSGSPRRSRRIVTAPIAANGVPVSFPRQYELARQWLATNQSEAVQIKELQKLEDR